jgi:hypothetical protein
VIDVIDVIDMIVFLSNPRGGGGGLHEFAWCLNLLEYA